MPISGHGWELHVQRLGVQVSESKKRTYGSYQVFQDGRALDGLSGFICECIGPGENTVPGTTKRIAQGTYPLSTQFGRYRTVGYSDDTSAPGTPPMPAILVQHTINRSGILIHPGHPPNLFLSSIGCFNPTSALLSWQEIDFWDSRSRVIALIDDLHRFAPDAFHSIENTMIPNASIVVEGEPMNILVSPDEAPALAGTAGGEVPPPDHPALELDDVFSSLAGGAGAAASVTGADTNYAVRQDVIDAVKLPLGGKPLFWGRYFKSPSTAGGAQYEGSLENNLLHSNNILVLPIGRQTNHVSGSEQTGRTDAKNNADAIVDAFSLDTLRNRTTRLLVFLDVEPENPVSADYYFGWASALVAYHNPPIFAPALYGNFGSSATWAHLSQAVGRGAECHGLWVARYFINAGCVPKPVWSNHAIPQGIPNGVQVLAWQFSAECVGADCNIVNPNCVQQLTDGLILPPAPALPPVVGALALGGAAPVTAAVSTADVQTIAAQLSNLNAAVLSLAAAVSRGQGTAVDSAAPPPAAIPGLSAALSTVAPHPDADAASGVGIARAIALPPFSQEIVDACASFSLRDAADVSAVFAGEGGFFAWYNSTLSGMPAFLHRGRAQNNALINQNFNQFWDQIPATFGAAEISMIEFCALMSVSIQETTGNLTAAPEEMNGQNRPHPGLAYAFDRIPGLKQSYNVAPNMTAYTLFKDFNYLKQHSGLAGSAAVLNHPGGVDQAWAGQSWPASYPSTVVNSSVNGFVMETDFYKFRGRGVIQTTWRSDYKLLISFILSSAAAGNPVLTALANQWLAATRGLTGDAQLEAIATISSNADWDRAFAQPLTLAAGVAIDSNGKGHYLTLSRDAAVLLAGKTTKGSLLHMAAKINGGSYPATVAPMMQTMMRAVAGLAAPRIAAASRQPRQVDA